MNIEKWLDRGFDEEIGDYTIDIETVEGWTNVSFFGPHSEELAKQFLENVCKKNLTNLQPTG